jgi:hypothetical protein
MGARDREKTTEKMRPPAFDGVAGATYARPMRPRSGDEAPAPSQTLWSSATGAVRLTRAAPGVMLFAYEGVVEAECVPAVITAIEREITLSGGGKPAQFVDVEKLSSHAPECRTKMVTWLRANRGRLGALHVYFRTDSRLIALSMSIVNLALGGAYTFFPDRPSFEEALARAKRSAKRVA